MPANAMVEPNGNVFWPVPTKLQSSCKVDVTYFPFDSQECSLKFGSWTYDGYQVDITNRTSEVGMVCIVLLSMLLPSSLHTGKAEQRLQEDVFVQNFKKKRINSWCFCCE